MLEFAFYYDENCVEDAQRAIELIELVIRKDTEYTDILEHHWSWELGDAEDELGRWLLNVYFYVKVGAPLRDTLVRHLSAVSGFEDWRE